jgi:hypothetical protein
MRDERESKLSVHEEYPFDLSEHFAGVDCRIPFQTKLLRVLEIWMFEMRLGELQSICSEVSDLYASLSEVPDDSINRLLSVEQFSSRSFEQTLDFPVSRPINFFVVLQMIQDLEEPELSCLPSQDSIRGYLSALECLLDVLIVLSHEA